MKPWATTPRSPAAIAARATDPSKKFVAEGSGPREDHLRNGEKGAGVHRIPGDEPALGGKDVVVEPGHQGQVVGQSPEKDHGQVGMGVDQARHDQTPRGVNGLPGLGEGVRPGAGPDKGDLSVQDADQRVLDDRQGFRHAQQGPSVDEDIKRPVWLIFVLHWNPPEKNRCNLSHNCGFFHQKIQGGMAMNRLTAIFRNHIELAKFTPAWVAELVDARDLKSLGPRGCAGSIPAPGTK